MQPEDHFRWKYFDIPTGSQMLRTFELDGRLVEFSGAQLHRWLVRGELHVTVDSTDQARHPDWQGRGLSRTMRPNSKHLRHPDAGFIFGYSTHPIHVKALNTPGGWRTLGNPIRTLTRPFGLTPLVPPRLRRGPTSSGQAHGLQSLTAEAFRHGQLTTRRRLANLARDYERYGRSLLARRSPERPSELTLRGVRQFDERFESLIASASEQFDFIHERALPFLNWRYCDPRGGGFTVRTAEHAGTILGYAVTRIDGDTARIADILVQPGREDVTNALLDDAVQLARRRRVAWIEMRLATRHPYGRAAARAGFVVSREDAGASFLPYEEEDSATELLLDPNARLHIVYGDSDHM